MDNKGRATLSQGMSLAVARGDSQYIKQRLQQAEDDVEWWLVLSAAYVCKHGDIVKLIQNSRRLPMKQLLYTGCFYGDLDFVREVIIEDKDVDDTDIDWGHCLDTACKRKHTGIVREIVGKRDTRYDNELMVACLDGQLECKQQTGQLQIPQQQQQQQQEQQQKQQQKEKNQQYGFAQESQDRLVYFKAAYYNQQTHVSSMLVQRGIVGLKDFIEDIYFGENIDMLEHVIEHTADVNAELKPGFNALHVASCSPVDIAIFDALVNHGADVNKKGFRGRTALHMMCAGRDDTMQKRIMGETDDDVQREVGIGKITKQQAQMTQSVYGLGCMEYLIHNHAQVDATDDNGQTPMHLVACCYDDDIVKHLSHRFKVLLDNNASVDMQDLAGMTPLALMALHDNINLMNMTLRKGCDINKQNIEGKSPLHIASEYGHLESVKILANSSNIDIDQQDNDGVTAISIASQSGHTDIVALLLGKETRVAKADIPDKDGRVALHKAVKNRHLKTTNELIKHNVNINIQDISGNTPLHDAVANKDINMMNLLFDAKCAIDLKNHLQESPIFIAVEICVQTDKTEGRTDIVDALLEKAATLSTSNIYGESLLSKAVENLDIHMMNYLLDHGVDEHAVNNKDQGLFHVLVNKICTLEHTPNLTQNIHAIISILEKQLDINSTDINQQSPLHLAAEAGCVATMHILLNRGADLTVRDKFNFLPLMWAVSHDEAFRVLFNETLKDLEDGDFQMLIRLGHWQSRLNVIAECRSHVKTSADLTDYPQKFVREDWFCNKDLSEFYQCGKERLTRVEFLEEWVSSLQPLTYINHTKITCTLSKFIKEVLAELSNLDPLVACEFRLSGSEREGAKIISTDEMDALSVLTLIVFEMFETPEEPGHPILQEFVKLHCKDQYRDDLKRVLDDNYYLSRSKLYHYYSTALSEVLANPKLWSKYPEIQRISHKDISPGNRTITPLMVYWSDDVYTLLKISIDMVPAVDLDWRPKWASTHSLLDELQTLIVPKWKTTAIEDDHLMEVGISHWGECFEAMPMEMRNGYRLCKVMKEVCPQIVLDQAEPIDLCDDWSLFDIKDIVTSYMMKQIIVKQYAASYYDNSVQKPLVKTDFEWAITIFDELETAFKEQELTSFFIPRYNLLHDEKFAQMREKGIKYAQLCKLLLTEDTAAHFRNAYMDIKERKRLSMD